MCILFTGENLRALRFKSSYAFFETPPWTDVDLLSITHPRTNFSEIWIEAYFLLREKAFENVVYKIQPFGLEPNMLYNKWYSSFSWSKCNYNQ